MVLVIFFASELPQEWGAGIVSDNTNTEDKSNTTVNVLRLSKFVLETVAVRELPKAMNKPWTRKPTVLMKLDIEGVEFCDSCSYVQRGCISNLLTPIVNDLAYILRALNIYFHRK